MRVSSTSKASEADEETKMTASMRCSRSMIGYEWLNGVVVLFRQNAENSL